MEAKKNSCLNFKAATEPKASDKHSDTGLVGATCRHGIPVRWMNIRGGGEKLCYANAILEEVMESPHCPENLVFLPTFRKSNAPGRLYSMISPALLKVT